MDLKKKEREFEHLNLSDTSVVKYIILHRSKIDITYGVGINIDINQAGDIFEFNQELIALYVSLDKLIMQCNFKEKQQRLLELVFDGHTLTDICTMDIGYKKSATYDLLDRLIARIVEKNNQEWKNSMQKMGYIKSSQ